MRCSLFPQGEAGRAGYSRKGLEIKTFSAFPGKERKEMRRSRPAKVELPCWGKSPPGLLTEQKPHCWSPEMMSNQMNQQEGFLSPQGALRVTLEGLWHGKVHSSYCQKFSSGCFSASLLIIN